MLAALLFSEKVADGFSFGNGKTKYEAQYSQAKQSISKGNRPPPSTFKRQPPPREYEPDCTKREDSDLCAQRRMAIAAEEQGRLNVIGLVLLAATLGFTGWAAWSAKRAAVATRDAAIAAQASAATANSTLATMEDNAERQLRAYVNVTGGDIIRFDTDRPLIRVSFQNFGATPAYNCFHWGTAQLRRFPHRGDLSVPAGQEIKRAGTLGPGAAAHAHIPLRAPILTEAQKASIRAETHALYVFGEYTYEDAFQKPRHVRFRLFYNGPPEPGNLLANAEEGNESD